eukprot:355803-Chlamydomonas_euryale.AAC.2
MQLRRANRTRARRPDPGREPPGSIRCPSQAWHAGRAACQVACVLGSWACGGSRRWADGWNERVDASADAQMEHAWIADARMGG